MSRDVPAPSVVFHCYVVDQQEIGVTNADGRHLQLLPHNCDSRETWRACLADLDKTVNRILEKYKSAVYTRDVGSFMRLYDSKVRIFDTWGVWSYDGAAKWQIAVEGWFTAHPEERIKVTFEDVQCSGIPEVAIVSAVITYRWVSAQGELLRTMQNRISWGLKTSGHVLRIVHEHTSVPVGYEDAKAILLRPPAN